MNLFLPVTMVYLMFLCRDLTFKFIANLKKLNREFVEFTLYFYIHERKKYLMYNPIYLKLHVKFYLVCSNECVKKIQAKMLIFIKVVVIFKS